MPTESTTTTAGDFAARAAAHLSALLIAFGLVAADLEQQTYDGAAAVAYAATNDSPDLLPFTPEPDPPEPDPTEPQTETTTTPPTSERPRDSPEPEARQPDTTLLGPARRRLRPLRRLFRGG